MNRSSTMCCETKQIRFGLIGQTYKNFVDLTRLKNSSQIITIDNLKKCKTICFILLRDLEIKST